MLKFNYFVYLAFQLYKILPYIFWSSVIWCIQIYETIVTRIFLMKGLVYHDSMSLFITCNIPFSKTYFVWYYYSHFISFLCFHSMYFFHEKEKPRWMLTLLGVLISPLASPNLDAAHTSENNFFKSFSRFHCCTDFKPSLWGEWTEIQENYLLWGTAIWLVFKEIQLFSLMKREP